MNMQQPTPQNPSMIAPAQPQMQPQTPQMAPPAPGQVINLSHSNRHRHDSGRTFLLIGLIIACLVAATFIGLFIWMFIRYDEASTDLNGQVSAAVAEAENSLTKKLENDFLEREKEPNKTFSGPEDYGEISFKYPKTWCVYVQTDAANGGNYQAFFSPGQVEPIKNETPNALRLTISTQSFESVVKTYESYVTSGRMTMSVISVGGNNANLYQGTLTNNLVGAVCIIKIRDKTVILQTDSELYMDDFMSLLSTVTYNS